MPQLRKRGRDGEGGSKFAWFLERSRPEAPSKRRGRGGERSRWRMGWPFAWFRKAQFHTNSLSQDFLGLLGRYNIRYQTMQKNSRIRALTDDLICDSHPRFYGEEYRIQNNCTTRRITSCDSHVKLIKTKHEAYPCQMHHDDVT